jgi:hypothetical protein
MNGSARGTAMVAFAIAVPLLVWAVFAARRGAERALMVWIGALAYLAYNAVMFLFATPYNRLFLLYVAMLSLALWALVALLTGVQHRKWGSARGMRFVAGYIWVVVALNALAWLRTIVPDLLDDRPGSFLVGMGVATNPVFVQDLSFWLPALAVAAWMLWSGRPAGWLLAGGGLVFWQIEALSVAVDQWVGHRADPASSLVSVAVVPMFLALFLVGLLPCWLMLRRQGVATRLEGEDQRPSRSPANNRTLET